MKAAYSNGWGMLIFYGLCGLILFFLVFPIFVIFPVSLSSARYLTFPPPDSRSSGISISFNDLHGG